MRNYMIKVEEDPESGETTAECEELAVFITAGDLAACLHSLGNALVEQAVDMDASAGE
jgi:hypothetical protein